MARQLDIDKMRRRAQLVQDAEAERAVAEMRAAFAATPLFRAMANIADSLTRSIFPNGLYAIRFDAGPEERH